MLSETVNHGRALKVLYTSTARRMTKLFSSRMIFRLTKLFLGLTKRKINILLGLLVSHLLHLRYRLRRPDKVKSVECRVCTTMTKKTGTMRPTRRFSRLEEINKFIKLGKIFAKEKLGYAREHNGYTHDFSATAFSQLLKLLFQPTHQPNNQTINETEKYLILRVKKKFTCYSEGFLFHEYVSWNILITRMTYPGIPQRPQSFSLDLPCSECLKYH